MSDYISALRKDLVEAAARQQQRSPARRASRSLLPRAWSPTTVLGAGAALAGLLLLVLTLRAVSPPRPPEAPKRLGTFHIGGTPHDAVAAGRHVVVADDDDGLRIVEPGRMRQLAPASPLPWSLASDGTALWGVRGPTEPLDGSELVKLDPRTGRRISRVVLPGESGSLALGAGGVWMIADVSSVRRGGRTYGGLEKIDPRTGERAVELPNVEADGIAASSRSVWTRKGETVTQRDDRGRVLNRVRGISPTVGFMGQRTMLADDDGAWVAGQSDGILYRIEHGQVVNRLKVGLLAGVLARTRDAVWVTVLAGTDRYELVRVDPDDAVVTGRVAIGAQQPQAIVPVGKQLWALTTRGDVVRVSQG
jgi:hypothetical protein